MREGRVVLAILACCFLVVTANGAVCELPDNGSGTVDLPPDCPGGYVGHMAIISGLPPGTTIEIDAVLRNFSGVVRTPGGALGGEVQSWDAQLEMVLMGTGMLMGYVRNVVMSVEGQTLSAPRVLGRPVQSFATEMTRVQGQITGDPDFDLLRITGGSDFGMPSPGSAILTLLPSGYWNIDSFFDITYRIDFVGAPGGMFAGLSGSTMGDSQFLAGEVAPPLSGCYLPDNGSGTANLPPDCPDGHVGHMAIMDGLPPLTTVEIEAVLRYFNNMVRTPGGTLGGEIQTWDAQLEMTMTGTGALSGYSRFLIMPVEGKTQSGPRMLGQPIQVINTEMTRLQGQITGDPDFDLLRVTAGNDFGLPSPGQAVLTQLPGDLWKVDSFFDITYRIDFVGAPGGILSGMSGSTTGTHRFTAGQTAVGVEERPSPASLASVVIAPNPVDQTTTISYVVPPGECLLTLEILDVGGRVVRTLVREHQEPGVKSVEWNGRNEGGDRVSSGVYYCRVQASGYGRTMKIVVLN